MDLRKKKKAKAREEAIEATWAVEAAAWAAEAEFQAAAAEALAVAAKPQAPGALPEIAAAGGVASVPGDVASVPGDVASVPGDVVPSARDIAANVAAQEAAAAEARAEQLLQAATDRAEIAEAMYRAALTRGEIVAAREKVLAEREAFANMRDQASGEREATATARDRTSGERDSIANGRDRAAAEREAVSHKRATLSWDPVAADTADHELEKARLEAELQRAHLDALTGAFRREMGRLALRNEIERARRANGKFVIAFIDVDGLKGVNDRDGHAAGDRVLRMLGATMRANMRSYDPIVRFGGDEFVCGISSVDTGEVQHRIGVIDQSLRQATGVGITAGLASLTGNETLEELTAKADAALLEAKRNRTE